MQRANSQHLNLTIYWIRCLINQVFYDKPVDGRMKIASLILSQINIASKDPFKEALKYKFGSR